MMGFLAPWMLLGVLTAAIPIALHLIQRHKPVVVHWAAMDFLLQSIRETRSASRLRDMILLAAARLISPCCWTFQAAWPPPNPPPKAPAPVWNS